MTLYVHTARVSYAGPDRFDVTRKSGTDIGKLFAPSWAILRPALDARKRAAKMRADADAREAATAAVRPDLAGLVRRNMLASAERMEREAWGRYVPAYLEEMTQSCARYRRHWDELLAGELVTLVCYCVDAQHCHRRILAELLATKGAMDCGERRA